MADAQTKYKLIILYMLRKVTFPLSNSQIMEFMIEKEYTDYFHIQEALNDLVERQVAVARVPRRVKEERFQIVPTVRMLRRT